MIGRIFMGMMAGAFFVAYATAAVAQCSDGFGAAGNGTLSHSGDGPGQFAHGGKHHHKHRHSGRSNSDDILGQVQMPDL